MLSKTRVKHVEKAETPKLWKIIAGYNDIYNLEGKPFQYTDLVEHEIILKPGKIVTLKSYRPPECHKEEIETQMHKLKEKGVIRYSKSPFNSPIWVVPKKKDASGKKKWRIIIDFRKVSEDTEEDGYSLPIIEDILNQLGNAKFFSAFDLSSGFHQIQRMMDNALRGLLGKNVGFISTILSYSA